VYSKLDEALTCAEKLLTVGALLDGVTGGVVGGGVGGVVGGVVPPSEPPQATTVVESAVQISSCLKRAGNITRQSYYFNIYI